MFYECLSFEDAWVDVLSDWFKNNALRSLKELPNGVVVPNASALVAVKERLFQENIFPVNLRFWTPGSLRSFLMRQLSCDQVFALREDLHLLMMHAASSLSGNPIFNVIKREPELLVRIYDTLTEAGMPLSVIKDTATRELLFAFQELLNQCHLPTIQSAVEFIHQNATHQPLLGSVVFYGFSSRNWINYKLLHALVKATSSPLLCFFATEAISEYDEVWQGTWEALQGFSQRLESDQLSPYQPLAWKAAFFDPKVSSTHETLPNPQYFVTESLTEEADLILAQIIHALNQNASRIGVVFNKQTSLLAREVSKRLIYNEIYHFDHLGSLPGTSPNQRIFDAWCHLQELPSLQSFTDLLQQLVIAQKISQELYLNFLLQATSAFREVMSEDLRLIKSILNAHSENNFLSIWQDWDLLPKQATFSQYINLTEKVLQIIGWPSDPHLLRQRGQILLENFKAEITREAFIRWLGGICKALGRLRHPLGSYPLAKVHLVTPEEAGLQAWSHLILTELISGEWPKYEEETPLFDDELIKSLNLKNITEGPQGAGHKVLKKNISLIPTSMERQLQAEHLFFKCVSLPTHSLVLTAHRLDSLNNNQELNISEFFERVYWASEQVLLDQDKIHRLTLKAKQLIQALPKKEEALLITQEGVIHQLVTAYKARRDQDVSFDEYSFCLKKSPEAGLEISCKAWEDLINKPAESWMKHLLGIEKAKSFYETDVKFLSMGTWIHDWLEWGLEGDTFNQIPNFNTWMESVNAKAERVFQRLSMAYAQVHRSLPDWLLEFWKISQSKAKKLVKSLTEQKLFSHVLSEYVLSPNARAIIPGILNLGIKGRIDVIGACNSLSLNQLQKCSEPITVVDYKTGRQGALTKNKILKGEGLQVALYMLGIRSLGYENVSGLIMGSQVKKLTPVTLESLLEEKTFWTALEAIRTTGKVGCKGPMRSEYSFNENFPLATLLIDKSILEHKWELTHGGCFK